MHGFLRLTAEDYTLGRTLTKTEWTNEIFVVIAALLPILPALSPTWLSW